jgi:hypothetical protein
MIGRLVGALIGRKVKEQIADAVLDKVDLPDPVESAIKAAATGDVTDVIKVAAKAVGKKK